MVSNNSPIGFFDSGIGGTSIWEEVIKLLPNENTIYLSDSKNAPYGERSTEEIIALCEKNTAFLIKENCKLIIVACNTASTNAITLLRDTYPIPFIGIEPAIKPASLVTKTNRIGVLATKGTLNSTLFEKTALSLRNTIQIQETNGKGLVPLIENGKLNSTETKTLLTLYLTPMLANNIDSLVLGCTHYPYLIPQIREIIGPDIKIIDSGEAVARQTKAILLKHNLLNSNKTGDTKHALYINANKKALVGLLKDSPVKNLKIIEQNF
jgi:glutamate racemase